MAEPEVESNRSSRVREEASSTALFLTTILRAPSARMPGPIMRTEQRNRNTTATNMDSRLADQFGFRRSTMPTKTRRFSFSPGVDSAEQIQRLDFGLFRLHDSAKVALMRPA